MATVQFPFIIDRVSSTVPAAYTDVIEDKSFSGTQNTINVMLNTKINSVSSNTQTQLTTLENKLSNIKQESATSGDTPISITTDDDVEVLNITNDGLNVSGTITQNGVEVATQDDINGLVKIGDDISSGNTVTIVYADIATSAVTDTNGVRLTEVSSKVIEVSSKVSNISVESTGDGKDSITITNDDNTEVVEIDESGVNVTGSLKKNNIEVATEDDIYDLSQAMITADDDETEIEDLDASYLTRLTNLESTTNELSSKMGTLESLTSNNIPNSATASGILGQMAYDENYIYIYVAENKWKRVSLENW